ncbi:MAG: LysM peptidoglycan-binding domain-containing protein [Eubacterium sp.]|nr:LysM peptidoglycan-binding domain-containing protein [Eubacterium sp.]
MGLMSVVESVGTSLAKSVFSSLLGSSNGGKDKKAILKIETESGMFVTFNCQFNPEQFHINSRGKFTKETRQGEDSPIVQFMGGSVSVLDLKLEFDTSTSYELGGTIPLPKKTKASDVASYVEILLDLVRIRGKLHRPPIVQFSWGSINFGGVATNVDATFTAFEPGGMPVRAEVTMQLMTMSLEKSGEMKISPKESPDRSKSILLTEDLSLWSIAEREYGDAGQWREIARANDIIDPLCVPTGTRLRVPALR